MTFFKYLLLSLFAFGRLSIGLAQTDPLQSAQLASGITKTYPTIKIDRIPAHIARLQAINRDIWTPFSEAYATADLEKYMALHTTDFIRASTEDTKDLNAYRIESQRHFNSNKTNKRRCEIAFAFFERVAGPLSASERGIYRYTSVASDGSRQHYYGRFHVFHRNIDGKWKIAVDYDSDEDNSIGEGDFNAGLAPDVFESAAQKPPKPAESIIREAIAAFSQKVVAGDWDAVAAAYTDDAKIFPGGQPILQGRAAIRGYWATSSKVLFHKITPSELKITGSEAWDWGVYEGRSVGADGKESTWKGKYVIVWKEVSPGDWKMYLDIWNRLPD